MKYGGLTRTQWRSYIAAGEKFHGETISAHMAIMALLEEIEEIEEAYDQLVAEIINEGPE